tara:strand:+ start:492 stop:596 length:105 start_codon:yes stop_codon:yes gene_type:complete
VGILVGKQITKYYSKNLTPISPIQVNGNVPKEEL